MQDPTLEDLELFLALYRARSISEAAKRRRLDPSTISRQLSDLERRLGSALFVRTREGVVPTSLGLAWVEPAERAESCLVDARRALFAQGSGAAGLVRVATLASLVDHVMLPALPPLLREHPLLRVSLLASPGLADLAQLEADLAVRLSRPSAGDLVARRLREVRYAAWASPSLARSLEGAPPERWPWVSPQAERGPIEAAWLAARGIVPRVEILTPSSIPIAARAGLGVALLPGDSGGHVEGLVPMVLGDPPRQSIQLWLVAHREIKEIPRIAVVWDWIVQTFTTETS